MAKQKKFDKVAVVKDTSRQLFRNMPKPKRVEDKRKKKPRFPERTED